MAVCDLPICCSHHNSQLHRCVAVTSSRDEFHLCPSASAVIVSNKISLSSVPRECFVTAQCTYCGSLLAEVLHGLFESEMLLGDWLES